ncbi:DnaD domain-containing protein [Weissella paramesenteroides]|jgi:DNA replication protein|uniref:DnaD domain-containing protein n=1 Tax=Weissella paramesenteroides TaxID=1249 RepID=UPI002073211E|nr:DnaD domain protein [Weissella paramesenteroides]MCM6765619.1 DnaD domain protein [Weissella paramesenteroides]MCM6766990.1 DnaD domain protein [Weissella paramesenteroides]MCM6769356.1 DnaD domain protein [Weissella paramesenteroides]MCM6771246.1 DnaD domain protein [Weissella paramesenteroides]MCM6779661.1 DnaD domain protein [Weissella paramesenteroides]
MKIDQDKLLTFLNNGHTTLDNFLLLHYREIGMNNEELLVYIQTKMGIDKGNLEPSTELISQTMGWSAKKVFSYLDAMRKKGLVNFKSRHASDGKVTTELDFNPLYLALLNIKSTEGHADERVNNQGIPNIDKQQTQQADIYNLIEQEFGRPLSQIEIETIKQWFDIDHFDPKFIKAAVQEAVLNSALNLRYIETILVSWQKKNYHSLNDIKNERQKYRQYKQLQADEIVDIPTDVDILNTDWDNLK